MSAAALLACLLTAMSVFVRASEVPPSPEFLLDEKDLAERWIFYSAEKSGMVSDTWVLEKNQTDEPVLRCTGKPFGYLRTKKSYRNFDLSLEWKYPQDESGNSGVLVFTNEPDKIWIKSIQIQLHTPTVGSILPNNGAKTEKLVLVKKLELPLDTWHKCRVESRDGTLTVFINDKKVSEVGDCDPAEGGIGLQSEGSEIHFRRIVVREFDSPAPACLGP